MGALDLDNEIPKEIDDYRPPVKLQNHHYRPTTMTQITDTIKQATHTENMKVHDFVVDEVTRRKVVIHKKNRASKHASLRSSLASTKEMEIVKSYLNNMPSHVDGPVHRVRTKKSHKRAKTSLQPLNLIEPEIV